MRVVVIVLVQRVIVSSQYNVSVFAIVVWSFFVFGRFKRTKYIRSETINQINSYQYAAELESYVF